MENALAELTAYISGVLTPIIFYVVFRIMRSEGQTYSETANKIMERGTTPP